MAVSCQECGFLNAEAANYCQRCGAPLARGPGSPEPATATYKIGDTGELVALDPTKILDQRPALIVRAGGGREGEIFPVAGDRLTIGRRPESHIFLDDVTVSRDHAVLVNRSGQWHIDDCGSLNGTYVNRSRIDTHRLQEGDEVQIGKYKLTFHPR